MRIFLIILLLLFLLMTIIFAILNANEVSLNYYIGSTSIPLSLLLAYTLLIGGLLGLLISYTLIFKTKKQLYQLRRKVKQ